MKERRVSERVKKRRASERVQEKRVSEREAARTPAPTPELNATKKWWAAFMGGRAFARARARAGNNETEPTTPAPKPRLTSPSAF